MQRSRLSRERGTLLRVVQSRPYRQVPWPLGSRRPGPRRVAGRARRARRKWSLAVLARLTSGTSLQRAAAPDRRRLAPDAVGDAAPARARRPRAAARLRARAGARGVRAVGHRRGAAAGARAAAGLGSRTRSRSRRRASGSTGSSSGARPGRRCSSRTPPPAARARRLLSRAVARLAERRRRRPRGTTTSRSTARPNPPAASSAANPCTALRSARAAWIRSSPDRPARPARR